MKQHALQVLVTCPGLLAMRADAVQQQFDALVQGLGVEAALVSRLICRLPRVLETLQVRGPPFGFHGVMVGGILEGAMAVSSPWR